MRAAFRIKVATHALVQAGMRAFAKKMDIVFGQYSDGIFLLSRVLQPGSLDSGRARIVLT